MHSDRKWLHFAISQVVFNALKYSRQEEHDSITFNIIEKESEIFLRITDQGIGIVPQDVKRVFDPFLLVRTGESNKNQPEWDYI